MGKLLSLAALVMVVMASCSKSVGIVVKDHTGLPYIGAQVTILTDNIPEIERDVVIDRQKRDQQDFEERLVVVGASIEEAKKKTKEQYDAYHEECPDLSPYGYVTDEMWSESAKSFNDKWMDINMSEVISGETDGMGTWNVKLKEGNYYVYVQGSSREQRFYGPLSVNDSRIKVFTLE